MGVAQALSAPGTSRDSLGLCRAVLVVSGAFPWAQEDKDEDKDQDWHRYPPWIDLPAQQVFKEWLI